MQALQGARIWAGGNWHDNHALLVAGGKIEAMISTALLPADADIVELDGGMLLPGFIDTQVNGGGGILFNDKPTVDGLAAIAQAHRPYGTTAMLPTVISDDLDVVSAAIAAVDEAISARFPGIVGIHIEGPFLNQGKRGIHDSSKFRVLDAEGISLLSSLKKGKTLVTLAPELAPPGAIAALVGNGVIVAAGHTLASFEDMQRAMAEGLSGITHLYNAMTALESRAPGVVGAALASNLVCGIIVDGQHVHPAALHAAYRAKGSHELMLVTDAMPTVGSDIDRFVVGRTEVFANCGTLKSQDGTLAGSNLDMASAFRKSIAFMRADISAASQMASGTPAAFLGLDGSHGRIASGYHADLVHLDDELNVRSVWIGGKQF